MKKYVWGFIATSVLINLIHFILYLYFVKPRYDLYQENGPIENLTAVFFLITFLVGIFFLSNSKNKKFFDRKWMLFLLTLGLLGFLDEVSFGQSWIGFSNHRLGGVAIDSIHDLIEAGYKNGGLFALIIIIPVALLIGAVHRCRKKIRESVAIKRYHPLYILMSFVVTLVFAATILDLPIIDLPNGRSNTPVEEILELNAAIALLFSIFCVYKIPRPEK